MAVDHESHLLHELLDGQKQATIFVPPVEPLSSSLRIDVLAGTVNDARYNLKRVQQVDTNLRTDLVSIFYEPHPELSRNPNMVILTALAQVRQMIGDKVKLQIIAPALTPKTDIGHTLPTDPLVPDLRMNRMRRVIYVEPLSA